MKIVISVALVICAVAMTARAQIISDRLGNDLYESCPESAPPHDKLWCYGYLAGYLDGVELALGGYVGRMCVPPKVQNSQIRDVVLRALREAPETRHERAYKLISRALAKAWPCP